MATATAPRTTKPVQRRESGISPATGSKLFNRVCVGVMLAFAVIWLLPLLWAVDTALKPNSETADLPVTWLIKNPTLDSEARRRTPPGMTTFAREWASR